MSIGLLLTLGLANAGSAVWFGEVTEPDRVDGTIVLAQTLVTDHGWGPNDETAIEHLASELEVLPGKLDEFDGELEIMRRIDQAIKGISVVRDQDRPLVFQALTLQGLAVHRYFQGTLNDDPLAAPYRLDGTIKPWAMAAAFDPSAPASEHLPDSGGQAAFGELRAAVLLKPTADIVAEGLPEGGTLWVDGRAIPHTAKVPPGQHWVAITVNGEIRARQKIMLAGGESLVIRPEATQATFDTLQQQLLGGPASISLDPTVLAPLEALEEPVFLVANPKRVYEVQGAIALRQKDGAETPDSRWALSLAGGPAWVHDGEFYVQNPDAPYETAVVNSWSPTVAVQLTGQHGVVTSVVGADVTYALGTHSSLPVGDTNLRVRPHPFVGVGNQWAQATIGYAAPWRLGVGIRGQVPFSDNLSLAGAYVRGFGFNIDDGGEGPDFKPEDNSLLWLGPRFSM